MLVPYRGFRRNGYCVQIAMSSERYVEVCTWCENTIGQCFGCRYQFWQNVGEWQFYTRSNMIQFKLAWGGLEATQSLFDTTPL